MRRCAILFGEALLDCFPDRSVVAGAPLHVAVHLARLGWDARLVTRLGDDADGARIRETLRTYGVNDDLVETDPELPTGRVTIEMDGTDHTFTIHRPAAWDAIEGPPELPPHDLFVHGSLTARDARSRTTLRRLLEQSSAFRVFDVNLRPPDVDPAVLSDGIAGTNLLKLNEAEVVDVAEALGFAPDPAAYFNAGPRLDWVCITRGSAGAELHARDGRNWRVEGSDIVVVDTVGAGDAFTSAIADALVAGRSPTDALESANAAAARIAAQRGGLPS